MTWITPLSKRRSKRLPLRPLSLPAPSPQVQHRGRPPAVDPSGISHGNWPRRERGGRRWRWPRAAVPGRGARVPSGVSTREGSAHGPGAAGCARAGASGGEGRSGVAAPVVVPAPAPHPPRPAPLRFSRAIFPYGAGARLGAARSLSGRRSLRCKKGLFQRRQRPVQAGPLPRCPGTMLLAMGGRGAVVNPRGCKRAPGASPRLLPCCAAQERREGSGAKPAAQGARGRGRAGGGGSRHLRGGRGLACGERPPQVLGRGGERSVGAWLHVPPERRGKAGRFIGAAASHSGERGGWGCVWVCV